LCAQIAKLVNINLLLVWFRLELFIYTIPGRGTEYCDVCLHVCVRVCPPVYLRNRMSKRQQIFVHRYGSVLFWRRCDTLCTSGFVDDVVFAYNERNGGVSLPQQSRCSVAYGLTPCCVVLVASGPGLWWAPELDESFVQGMPGGGGVCTAPLPCFEGRCSPIV